MVVIVWLSQYKALGNIVCDIIINVLTFMSSEPLYRTEIDPLEIETETKIVSIWDCAVSKTEGGRGHGGGADPKTLGKGPYDPSEASLKILERLDKFY